jgi:hypothetical protein
MTKFKFSFLIGALFFFGMILIAADHIEAPAVSGGTADITDYYAFQGDSDKIAFVANVQGLLSPNATENASFDENVLTEFNIDTDGDAVEDVIIQAIPRDGKMYFFGPIEVTGQTSGIMTNATRNEVNITNYGDIATLEFNDDMKFFAGPRDDPFFMDFARYGEIIGGMATSFNDPGSDTFAGTNVMSIVVEVPKSMIGNTGSINTWVETKIQ